MSEPAPAPGAGKLSDDEKKRRAAEHQKAYRERQKVKKAGKGKGGTQVPAGVSGAAASPVSPAATPAPTKLDPKHVRAVEDSLTGGVGAITSAAVVVLVHPDAPTPDVELVRRVMAPWAPLLARHVAPEDTGKLAIAMAAGASAAHAMPYVKELKAWVRANPEKVKPREQPTQAP